MIMIMNSNTTTTTTTNIIIIIQRTIETVCLQPVVAHHRNPRPILVKGYNHVHLQPVVEAVAVSDHILQVIVAMKIYPKDIVPVPIRLAVRPPHHWVQCFHLHGIFIICIIMACHITFHNHLPLLIIIIHIIIIIICCCYFLLLLVYHC